MSVLETELREDRHPRTLRPSAAALLLVDVINPMDFAGAKALLPAAERAAHSIARLKRRLSATGIPAIYVNDNFDRWHVGFHELVAQFHTANVPGVPIIRLLEPDPSSDYYVLKPRHSGFFRTGLEVLLERLESRILIITGFATDICVLFTANDAYMRGFQVIVPSDCAAAESEVDHEHSLRHMQRTLKAKVVVSDLLDGKQLAPEVPSATTGRRILRA
jgi:nicotinamidase-related amidase